MKIIKKNPNKINSQFINIITELHSKSSEKFGFYFDTQIGGMRQPNDFDQNWAVFFAEKRLNVIFETICETNPLPKKIVGVIKIKDGNERALPSVVCTLLKKLKITSPAENKKLFLWIKTSIKNHANKTTGRIFTKIQ